MADGSWLRLRSPRVALLGGILAFLAGCTEESAPPPAARPAYSVAFAEGSADLIEVRLDDRQPIETAELLAADGTAIAAGKISSDRTTTSTEDSGLGIGVAVEGGSSGVHTDIGLGVPLFGTRQPSPIESFQSRALVRVPDMAAYRAGWQHWVLRLLLGSRTGTERQVELRAPSPPEE
jgi:hypothetical protein